jgi:H+/gluconate symporter-like permease
MALRELRGITRSASVAAAATLALSAPIAAAYASTDIDGTPSTSAGSHRTQPVHDDTLLLPLAPLEPASTTTSWDVLPVATGAAGGILLVVITFAGVTVVRHRRYEQSQVAPPV